LPKTLINHFEPREKVIPTKIKSGEVIFYQMAVLKDTVDFRTC
jgi:hypothetical protein